MPEVPSVSLKEQHIGRVEWLSDAEPISKEELGFPLMITSKDKNNE